MGCDSVVVVDPARELPDDGVGIGEVGAADVIPLDRVDEGLGQPVGLPGYKRVW
jgi:hypothetical protein